MGFTIQDEVKTTYGLALSNLYCSFQGNYSIMKIKFLKKNYAGGSGEPDWNYKLTGTAAIWVNKESYLNGSSPLQRDILIELNDVTPSQLEQEGGLMKNILYPKLRELLQITNYIDD